MILILSQRIVTKSEYNDIPFRRYHYPRRYRNQIKSGDFFIYYQGDRYKRENRYYYGCGIVGEITMSEDNEHYYAEILNGIKFPENVPIYIPSGGFYESIGFETVREKEKPAWQNSIRKTSEESFKKIISSSGLIYTEVKELFYSSEHDYRILILEEEYELINRIIKNYKEQDLENIIENASDQEIDKIISTLDGSGSIGMKLVFQKVRNASRKTITTLKNLYNYTCQICGSNHNERYSVNVVEAHHIDSFSETKNHQPSNIVILCPTHHRLMHAGKSIFDRTRKVFIYENKYEEKLLINKHL